MVFTNNVPLITCRTRRVTYREYVTKMEHKTHRMNAKHAPRPEAQPSSCMLQVKTLHDSAKVKIMTVLWLGVMRVKLCESRN